MHPSSSERTGLNTNVLKPKSNSIDVTHNINFLRVPCMVHQEYFHFIRENK